jgi:hypothetical protein
LNILLLKRSNWLLIDIFLWMALISTGAKVFAVVEAKVYAIIYGASEMAEGSSYLNPFCVELKKQGLVPCSAN